MNPGTFLPQELIYKFVEDLWFEGDTDTVKTLSQTSRLFLHRCRHHLFSYMRLSSESFTRQSQRIARKAKNLEDILVRTPEIANYVRRLFLEIPRYNAARAHIISRLLLRLSTVNSFSLWTPTACDWTSVAPELQSTISRLAYSPRMKTFSLQGIMVSEKSTDKISHNTLTSCDHLPSMFYLLLTILVIFTVFI